MQKRSHTLLARTLMDGRSAFDRPAARLAFLFGSVEPDCNPLSYLKGSFRCRAFMGHNFANARPFIHRRILRLQRRERWNLWHYYTLGKLTHYLADAFTCPHNENYTGPQTAHHRYESDLRLLMNRQLPRLVLRPAAAPGDLSAAIDELHRQYLGRASDRQRDMGYILRANSLLLEGLLPQVR